MVSIREDINLGKNKFEDFFDYTIFELFQGYWRYVYKTRNQPKFKYYWWEIKFTKVLGSTLEKNGQRICLVLDDLWIKFWNKMKRAIQRSITILKHFLKNY